MERIIISIILSAFFAQVYKVIKKKSLKSIFETGGMPSSHTSSITALTTGIYFHEGITTTLILSFVFLVVTIRDATGVRLTAGQESIQLKKIEKKLKIKDNFNYSMGHTPKQVTAGLIIGLITTIIVFYL